MQMDRLTITLLISSTDYVLYRLPSLFTITTSYGCFGKAGRGLTFFKIREVSYLSVPQSPQLRGR